MSVSDITVLAEVLIEFIKNLGKKELNVSKLMAKNLLQNPGRALDITTNVVSALASRNPEAALSALLEVRTFYNTGEGFYLGKFV